MAVFTDSIVLTGCGWVTPFAAGSISTVLTAANRSKSKPPADGGCYWAVPDDTPADYPELSKELQGNKGAWMTAVALEHARREAGLQPDSVAPEHLGLALGCALAGQLGMIGFADEVRQQSARFVSPIHFPQTVGNYIAGALARGYAIQGPNVTLSSGIASGLDALIEGCQLLRGGGADVVFAGGTDCLSDALVRGLVSPKSGHDSGLGARDSGPSEGACLFVLERADHAERRGATPLATVTGSRHLPAGSAVEAATSDTLVSIAGVRLPGAVLIEHWVGRCFAALSASAVAAAIGAAGGSKVPLADAESVSVGQVAVSTSTRILAVADADGAHLTTLQLTT